MNTPIEESIQNANRARFVSYDRETENRYRKLIESKQGEIQKICMFQSDSEKHVSYYTYDWEPDKSRILENVINPEIAWIDKDGAIHVEDVGLLAGLTRLSVDDLDKVYVSTPENLALEANIARYITSDYSAELQCRKHIERLYGPIEKEQMTGESSSHYAFYYNAHADVAGGSIVESYVSTSIAEMADDGGITVHLTAAFSNWTGLDHSAVERIYGEQSSDCDGDYSAIVQSIATQIPTTLLTQYRGDDVEKIIRYVHEYGMLESAPATTGDSDCDKLLAFMLTHPLHEYKGSKTEQMVQLVRECFE